MLPPIVHLRKKPDQAALRRSVERMMQELREPQPGDFLVVQQLAYMESNRKLGVSGAANND